MSIFEILVESLGPQVVYRGSDESRAAHLRDFKHAMPEGTQPGAIAIPRTVEEASEIMRLCHEQRQPVTAQGGLTGLVAGGLPEPGGVALSLDRMRSVIEIDPEASTMTVEAGAPLEMVQRKADEAGFLFPLDLGARGSASIGGNAATNAGGNRVLRYGMMRDLVLGIEVVLADGMIMTALNKMQKANVGYDLKHLFMGSEGTLGIITKLVLRLFPKPLSECTAFCAVESYADAMKLLTRARESLGGTLSAFEVIWPSCYSLMKQALGSVPIPEGHGLYVLLDALGSEQETDQARFEQMMEQALVDGVIADAVIAQSKKDSAALWNVRDCVGEFSRLFGPGVSFDVSVPVGQIPDFIATCDARLAEKVNGSRTIWFGHVADSNLHLMTNFDGQTKPTVRSIVYDSVREWNGAISAEHGIGTIRKEFVGHSRSPEEIALMRTLKHALDPLGILNPGKLL